MLCVLYLVVKLTGFCMRIHRARRALKDCRIALKRFESEPIDDEFRLNLFLCLALLRAVGHIIQSEVSEHEDLGAADRALWPIRSLDPIFRNFIYELRNSVIKQYRCPVKWASIKSTEGDRMEYLITEGVYVNKDVRELIGESIDWWESYIQSLESSLYQK